MGTSLTTVEELLTDDEAGLEVEVWNVDKDDTLGVTELATLVTGVFKVDDDAGVTELLTLEETAGVEELPTLDETLEVTEL